MLRGVGLTASIALVLFTSALAGNVSALGYGKSASTQRLCERQIFLASYFVLLLEDPNLGKYRLRPCNADFFFVSLLADDAALFSKSASKNAYDLLTEIVSSLPVFKLETCLTSEDYHFARSFQQIAAVFMTTAS